MTKSDRSQFIENFTVTSEGQKERPSKSLLERLLARPIQRTAISSWETSQMKKCWGPTITVKLVTTYSSLGSGETASGLFFRKETNSQHGLKSSNGHRGVLYTVIRIAPSSTAAGENRPYAGRKWAHIWVHFFSEMKASLESTFETWNTLLDQGLGILRGPVVGFVTGYHVLTVATRILNILRLGSDACGKWFLLPTRLWNAWLVKTIETSLRNCSKNVFEEVLSFDRPGVPYSLAFNADMAS